MASTIVTKNSSTASAVPVTGDLTQGELAVNVTDKKLYTKDSGGTVVKLVGGLGNQEANAVAITGGSINGTTVGATTASTGAFTTLSASSTVSGTGFSTYLASPPAIGGTAAAAGSFTTLSASSTTTLSGGTANGVAYLNGSKVVTTGSALTFDGSNLGVGTSPLAARVLSVKGRAAFTALANDSQIAIYSDGSTNGIYSTYNSTGSYLPMTFYINDAEQMRLTSTGLGIGTSSPADILTLAGGASGSYGLTINNAKEGGGTKALFQYDRDNALAVVGANTTNGLVFKTLTSGSLTTKATLDSSGNLGLGVTPSAWATFKAMQIGNGTADTFIAVSGNQGDFGVNAYYNAGWKYQTSSVAASRYEQSSGVHQWFNAPSGTAGNAISFTQAMTLDASGNLGVGVTNPGNKIALPNNSFISFRNTSGSEVGYIGMTSGNLMSYSDKFYTDSSGNLLVGTTSTFDANDSSNPSGQGFQVSPSAFRTLNLYADSGSVACFKRSGNDGAVVLFSRGGVGSVGSISVTTSATAYNTSSDYRLKEAIQPMTGALAKVAALKPCTYKWKADGSDGEGFIAHELAEVVPQCVTGEKDAIDDDGNPQYQGIDTSFLVATLTAAIQEQQAIIEQLKADVAALKGN